MTSARQAYRRPTDCSCSVPTTTPQGDNMHACYLEPNPRCSRYSCKKTLLHGCVDDEKWLLVSEHRFPIITWHKFHELFSTLKKTSKRKVLNKSIKISLKYLNSEIFCVLRFTTGITGKINRFLFKIMNFAFVFDMQAKRLMYFFCTIHLVNCIFCYSCLFLTIFLFLSIFIQHAIFFYLN